MSKDVKIGGLSVPLSYIKETKKSEFVRFLKTHQIFSEMTNEEKDLAFGELWDKINGNTKRNKAKVLESEIGTSE